MFQAVALLGAVLRSKRLLAIWIGVGLMTLGRAAAAQSAPSPMMNLGLTPLNPRRSLGRFRL